MLPLALLARSEASQRWMIRSRMASAAARNQSRSVAEPASFPTARTSLASTALLISTSASSPEAGPLCSSGSRVTFRNSRAEPGSFIIWSFKAVSFRMRSPCRRPPIRRFIANRRGMVAVQGVCRTPAETLPQPARRACGYPCAAPACQSALKRTPQLRDMFPPPGTAPEGWKHAPRLRTRTMDHRCRRSTRCPRDPCRCSRARRSPAFPARAMAMNAPFEQGE